MHCIQIINNIHNGSKCRARLGKVITPFFPKGWQASELVSPVLKGNRKLKDENLLMRILMLHVAKGYSLSETSVRSEIGLGISISSVGIMNALQRSEEWFKSLCSLLFKEQEGSSLPSQKKIMRLVDGTIVKEAGKTGSQWRINYSFSLPDFRCDYFDLCPAKGKGNGESLQRYDVSKDDCIIADRGFSTFAGINHIKSQGGDVIVRVNTRTLPMYTNAGEKFDLLEKRRTLKSAGKYTESTVTIRNSDGSEKLSGRVCIIRKDRDAAKLAQKKIKRAAEDQKSIKPETLEYAKYIIVFTTLNSDEYSTQEILEWYRVRWQIELSFKRLKSLAGFGHIPKHDPASSRAWLYGKLFFGMLIEKMIRYAQTISPWGFQFSAI